MEEKNIKKDDFNYGTGSFICAIVFGLSILSFFIDPIAIIYLFCPLLLLVPLVTIVLSITWGIMGIVKRNKTTFSFVKCIMGLSISIGIILVLIILFSAEILVIRFM